MRGTTAVSVATRRCRGFSRLFIASERGCALVRAGKGKAVVSDRDVEGDRSVAYLRDRQETTSDRGPEYMQLAQAVLSTRCCRFFRGRCAPALPQRSVGQGLAMHTRRLLPVCILRRFGSPQSSSPGREGVRFLRPCISHYPHRSARFASLAIEVCSMVFQRSRQVFHSVHDRRGSARLLWRGMNAFPVLRALGRILPDEAGLSSFS